MTFELKTSAEAKPLFRVKMLNKSTCQRMQPDGKFGRDPDTQSVEIMSESTLEHYRKYNTYWHTILDAEPLGPLWPEGVTVLQTSSTTPFRCCHEAKYLVKSPRLLTDEDKEVLRAQGCFMSGQEEGSFSDPSTVEGGFEYIAKSFCDSGD